MTDDKAVKELKKHYRKLKRERDFKETFVDPFTKEERDNYVMVPVKLMNALIARKKVEK